ncbi:asparagine synthase-related protein [Virgibacillus chiguensis]|uniref:asparagine synthase (glutamine-hydrolyzing) n=1 Tax=Virgibacillus chiguensis TaxID=411959 RepID=A0A1M5TAV3_9BACI|nr:asparagine synthase-related protein [Virgibacillus chiguensis]SHH47831.1 Asparagine synthetase B (glutamine-hydrolyzing) [Virgibacillus chiguensis]
MNWFIMSSQINRKIIDIEKFQILTSKFINNKGQVNEIFFNGFHFIYMLTNNSRRSSILSVDKNLFIFGDIEMHNKNELARKYNLLKDSRSAIDEFSILLTIYQKKGIDVLNEIVGDFSIIIIDTDKNIKYFIRDQLGKKTLFHTYEEDHFFVSSDLFLLDHIIKNRKLNTDYFFEYFNRNGVIDNKLTPYKRVYRIPSGHYIRVQEKEHITFEYWCLTRTIQKETKLQEEEYTEQFYSLLENSVKSRIQDHSKSAVMLSGGLDSTSVYAISKLMEQKSDIKVSSVSAVFDQLKEADERQYINPLLEKYNDKGHFVNYDDNLLYENIPFNSPYSHEPFVDILTYEFTNKTIERAAEREYLNILTGFGGDHLLAGSLFMTKDFFKKGKLKKIVSFLTNHAIVNNISAFNLLKKYTLFPNVATYHSVNKYTNYYHEITNKLKNIKYYHQKELYIQLLNTKPHYIDRILGGRNNVSIHHPFLDRKLIEFVYNLPPEFRLSKTYNKYILRESMKKLLTNDIINNLNKVDHDVHTYESIQKNWSTIYRRFNEPLLINELNLVSHLDWNDKLIQWRNGVEQNDDFWTLLSIEVWYKKYLQKVKSD